MEWTKALEYVQRAKAVGAERGVEVSVAVHDPAGHPVLVARGKTTAWHGPYMAMGKARLAAAFRKPTADLCRQWEGRPMFAQSLTEIIPGGVTLNKGGYPLYENGQLIGAIGVGGGSPDVDDFVARTAAAWDTAAPAAAAD